MNSRPTEELSRLLKELLATFPGILIMAFPIRGPNDEIQIRDMVAARENGCMRDGLPFFNHFCEIEACAHAVHPALDRRLEVGGWYLERYDEAWYLPARLPTGEDRAEWARLDREASVARIGPPTQESLDPCPF